MPEKKKDYRHTVFDDAFRTVEKECPDALVHFVNQVFNEHYSVTDKVEYLRNEHFIQQEDGKANKRISDSHFRIIRGSEAKNYHLECESSGYSKDILIRMFEYGVLDAIEDREVIHNRIKVNLPNAGLLVLRSKGNPPKEATIDISTPGGDVCYDVPVICMNDYTLDDLFDKKIYFLIPFFFFNLEKEIPLYNKNEERLKEFENTYCDIIERVREVPDNELSLRSKGVIIKQMEQVVKRLAYRNNNVKDKVGDIMGGKVVKMEWLEKYDADMAESRRKGKEEGLEAGREEERVSLIKNLMDSLKCSAEQAMEKLKIPKSEYNKYMMML